jgi:hypothetical protein
MESLEDQWKFPRHPFCLRTKASFKQLRAQLTQKQRKRFPSLFSIHGKDVGNRNAQAFRCDQGRIDRRDRNIWKADTEGIQLFQVI